MWSSRPGCHGSRLTGAGFGGCAVFLLDRARTDDAVAHIQQRFQAAFGRRPEVALYRGDPGPREL